MMRKEHIHKEKSNYMDYCSHYFSVCNCLGCDGN